MNSTKEVYFDVYCPRCEHWEKSESEDPCYDCLEDGWNTDSHKPVRFKEAQADVLKKRAKEANK